MAWVFSIIMGVLVADFLSGFIHWIQDRYAKPSWPIVGGAVADAHEHHSNPGKMLKASFWKRNGSTMILVGIIGLIVAAFGGLNVVTITALFVGSLANEIHATTHRRTASWWITVARVIGLIQYPSHHAIHHKPNSKRRYCVITSWLNAALDHLQIWAVLELILLCFGVWPNGEELPIS